MLFPPPPSSISCTKLSRAGEGQKYGYTKNSCEPVVLSRGRHHSTGEKTKRIAGVIFILQKIEGVFAYIPASR